MWFNNLDVVVILGFTLVLTAGIVLEPTFRLRFWQGGVIALVCIATMVVPLSKKTSADFSTLPTKNSPSSENRADEVTIQSIVELGKQINKTKFLDSDKHKSQ